MLEEYILWENDRHTSLQFIFVKCLQNPFDNSLTEVCSAYESWWNWDRFLKWTLGLGPAPLHLLLSLLLAHLKGEVPSSRDSATMPIFTISHKTTELNDCGVKLLKPLAKLIFLLYKLTLLSFVMFLESPFTYCCFVGNIHWAG